MLQACGQVLVLVAKGSHQHFGDLADHGKWLEVHVMQDCLVDISALCQHTCSELLEGLVMHAHCAMEGIQCIGDGHIGSEGSVVSHEVNDAQVDDVQHPIQPHVEEAATLPDDQHVQLVLDENVVEVAMDDATVIECKNVEDKHESLHSVSDALLFVPFGSSHDRMHSTKGMLGSIQLAMYLVCWPSSRPYALHSVNRQSGQPTLITAVKLLLWPLMVTVLCKANM